MNRVIRIAPELGLLYEADPRHVELLPESTGLVGCSSVKTPGVKPVDASTEAPKGEEGELDGVVINSSGVVYEASATTQLSKVATHSSSDCEKTVSDVDKSMAHRSLYSIMNDSNLDWKFDVAGDQHVEMSVADQDFEGQPGANQSLLDFQFFTL